MKVDVIMTWPKSLDYPQCRSQLEWFSPYFEKIIIVFTGNDIYDYSSFVRGSMGFVEPKTVFLESRAIEGHEDWRNVAVNQALEKSDNEWVLFLEQDFFWKNQNFLKTIYESGYPVAGFWEANRLHPAFLLVKRGIIEKTKKDFGTIPDQLDHFGKFSQDIVAQIGEHNIFEFDKKFEMRKDWYHLQGVTHNYNLCRAGDIFRIFKPDEFQTYNMISRIVRVKQSQKYLDFAYQVHEMLGFFNHVEWLKEFWKYQYLE